MKTSSIAVAVAAVLGLAGCGQKPAEGTPAAPTPPAAPSAAERAPAPTPAPVVAVQEAQKVAVVAAKQAAPEVKTQAAEAFANLGQQLVAATRDGATDAVLKNIGADLETRVGKLAQSLAGNEAVKAQLNTGIRALQGNQDLDAVAALNTLVAARLTPDQTALAKDVYQAGAAFVVQRNFASVPGASSEVGQLVNAVWKGDYTQAVVPLQKVYGKASLTAAQKNLLATTFDPYLPKGWKEAAGALQQGVDQFKKLKF